MWTWLCRFFRLVLSSYSVSTKACLIDSFSHTREGPLTSWFFFPRASPHPPTKRRSCNLPPPPSPTLSPYPPFPPPCFSWFLVFLFFFPSTWLSTATLFFPLFLFPHPPPPISHFQFQIELWFPFSVSSLPPDFYFLFYFFFPSPLFAPHGFSWDSSLPYASSRVSFSSCFHLSVPGSWPWSLTFV